MLFRSVLLVRHPPNASRTDQPDTKECSIPCAYENIDVRLESLSQKRVLPDRGTSECDSPYLSDELMCLHMQFRTVDRGELLRVLVHGMLLSMRSIVPQLLPPRVSASGRRVLPRGNPELTLPTTPQTAA